MVWEVETGPKDPMIKRVIDAVERWDIEGGQSDTVSYALNVFGRVYPATQPKLRVTGLTIG